MSSEEAARFRLASATDPGETWQVDLAIHYPDPTERLRLRHVCVTVDAPNRASAIDRASSFAAMTATSGTGLPANRIQVEMLAFHCLQHRARS